MKTLFSKAYISLNKHKPVFVDIFIFGCIVILTIFHLSYFSTFIKHSIVAFVCVISHLYTYKYSASSVPAFTYSIAKLKFQTFFVLYTILYSCIFSQHALHHTHIAPSSSCTILCKIFSVKRAFEWP